MKAGGYGGGGGALIFGSQSEEAMRLPADCYACAQSGECRMCITTIPHFREVVIMAFVCEHCGYKSNEVKAGGAIPPQGERITLVVDGTCPEDMARDVLKSDSAGLTIPEIDLEMAAGSLGGLYTTVEGLLKKVRENLIETNPFFDQTTGGGDSQPTERQVAMEAFTRKFDALCTGEVPFTLTIDDPLANSFVYSELVHDATLATPGVDPKLRMEKYDRTWDEDEELGLHDLRTEGYEEDGVLAAQRALEQRAAAGASAPEGSELGALLAAVAVPPEFDGVFEAAGAFDGNREGCAFKLGSRGLGYYGRGGRGAAQLSDKEQMQQAGMAAARAAAVDGGGAATGFGDGGAPMARTKDHPTQLTAPIPD